jgi:hypothetical protein
MRRYAIEPDESNANLLESRRVAIPRIEDLFRVAAMAIKGQREFEKRFRDCLKAQGAIVPFCFQLVTDTESPVAAAC